MRPIPFDDARERLRAARLMLLFTPELAGARDPLAALAAALPHVDVVQVRVKSAEHPDGAAPARALYEWTERVLAVASGRALVVLDDRVDVAAALLAEGVHGVHVGARDLPVDAARALLGPDALIGLSTRTAADVARAERLPLDYLGFGPIFPTATKGYASGIGPEAAWIASQATALPVFPIGGVDAANASELAPVGRACVGAGVLAAADPAAAAAAIRAALADG